MATTVHKYNSCPYPQSISYKEIIWYQIKISEVHEVKNKSTVTHGIIWLLLSLSKRLDANFWTKLPVWKAAHLNLWIKFCYNVLRQFLNLYFYNALKIQRFLTYSFLFSSPLVQRTQTSSHPVTWKSSVISNYLQNNVPFP